MIQSNMHVRIPDDRYWRSQIKCQDACPVHTDARGYVRAIAEGKDELAYLIARGPNPLASICGWVCGAPCERACRRGDVDKPVAIRALKRYVCQRFGPEARGDGGRTLIAFLKDAAKRHVPRDCQGKEEILPFLQSLTNGGIRAVRDKSVGIIGSGPAGLAAAHDLRLMGFEVTIYEMERELGGMLAVGIPQYRLPRDVIRAEVEVITAMGVRSVTHCTVGKDVTLSELRQQHDAVLIAVGAKASSRLPIPGADAEGVIGGIEFLRAIALGDPPSLGRRVVVIGGGNVAFDVGRSVLRQISMDAARSAVRSGADAVHLCSLESLEEMPADDIEILEGDEEGIKRVNSVGPKEILRDARGKVRGIVLQKCLRVFDDDHGFNPRFDAARLTEIPCETVLVAIGQRPRLDFLDPEKDGIEMTPRGFLACDPETGATSAADVFVAGDLAYGPRLLIHAVASGKHVARTIYARLTGRAIQCEDVTLHFPVKHYEREKDYEKRKRIAGKAAPVHERTQSHTRVVEDVLTEEDARNEASRCLDCGVNTIFDGEKCVLCGGCVEICPEACLRLVSLDRLSGSPIVTDVVHRRLDDYPVTRATAIVKDETRCIRCALCADRCPSDAITMERYCFREELLCQAV